MCIISLLERTHVQYMYVHVLGNCKNTKDIRAFLFKRGFLPFPTVYIVAGVHNLLNFVF